MNVFSTWKLPPDIIEQFSLSKVTIMENDTSRLYKKVDLLKINKSIDGLITLLTDTVDAEVMDYFSNLKVIGNVAVGYNNIDIEAAAARKIIVTNTPDILTDATADLAVALVLSLARQIVAADSFVRAGKFKGWHPGLFIGRGFSGKVFGIFGMGKIGQKVAVRMRSFGCNIIYHNRSQLDQQIEQKLDAKYVSFEELLSTSDYLCVLAPLTPETRGAFGAGEFQMMKKGSMFFNIARGPIIDEEALSVALASGHLGGAGLDVYEKEPVINPALLAMENVVLLPHIGSAEEKTRNDMFLLASKNVINVLTGGKALTPVSL